MHALADRDREALIREREHVPRPPGELRDPHLAHRLASNVSSFPALEITMSPYVPELVVLLGARISAVDDPNARRNSGS